MAAARPSRLLARRHPSRRPLLPLVPPRRLLPLLRRHQPHRCRPRRRRQPYRFRTPRCPALPRTLHQPDRFRALHRAALPLPPVVPPSQPLPQALPRRRGQATRLAPSASPKRGRAPEIGSPRMRLVNKQTVFSPTRLLRHPPATGRLHVVPSGQRMPVPASWRPTHARPRLARAASSSAESQRPVGVGNENPRLRNQTMPGQVLSARQHPPRRRLRQR